MLYMCWVLKRLKINESDKQLGSVSRVNSGTSEADISLWPVNSLSDTFIALFDTTVQFHLIANNSWLHLLIAEYFMDCMQMYDWENFLTYRYSSKLWHNCGL